MVTKKDIVIVGLQPWDIEIGSNCKNIAIEFAKTNRVLYVNAPIDSKTLLKDRKKKALQKRLALIRKRENLVRVTDNLWTLYPSSVIQSINWLPNSGIFTLLNKWNNRRFSRDILYAMTALSFHDIILFNDSDMIRSFYLPELLKPQLSIYYSRDNLMTQPYFFKHGHLHEPELMAKSDIVFANSEYLAGLARKYNKHSYDIGQGCDLSVFDPAISRTIPGDLKEIKRPVIGYIGALSAQRLDLDLLLDLCGRMTEWSFVFVGKQDEVFAGSSLNTLPNVHFLGLKEEKVLADYLAFFDVAINPQQINEMTIGNYPRKIDEYLAMGKPVVATETVTMQLFRNHVYLGKTASDYSELIKKALSENVPQTAAERIAFANTHTWENCVRSAYGQVEKIRPDLKD